VNSNFQTNVMVNTDEDEGIARSGFVDAGQAMLLRYLTQGLQVRPK
jgi:hypothetical protein